MIGNASMWAILSDIHANLEALEAVLEDMLAFHVERIICLGDIVGYGPDPVECLRIVRRFDVVLMGNFDLAIAVPDDSGDWPSSVLQSFTHTRQSLDASQPQGYWYNYLESRPRMVREKHVLLVHGSPRNPLYEYMFPEDIYNPRKMNRISQLSPALTFVGHTHLPGVFVFRGEDQHDYHASTDVETHAIGPEQRIINVGSVGQPRDNDPRACYVLYDGSEVVFRRVPYDVERTIAKVHAIPELNNIFGDRLREGR